MSIFFRKGFKFGPFKLNLSKSGAGISTGVTGLTAGVNSKGMYAAGGANGLYFRKRFARHKQAISQAHGSDVSRALLILLVLCVSVVAIILAFWAWFLLF